MPLKIRFTWTSWLSHCIVIFFFNESKNSAVPELRTGNFRRLVGFEAKDLSFEAKDFLGTSQGLHRW